MPFGEYIPFIALKVTARKWIGKRSDCRCCCGCYRRRRCRRHRRFCISDVCAVVFVFFVAPEPPPGSCACSWWCALCACILPHSTIYFASLTWRAVNLHPILGIGGYNYRFFAAHLVPFVWQALGTHQFASFSNVCLSSWEKTAAPGEWSAGAECREVGPHWHQ